MFENKHYQFDMEEKTKTNTRSGLWQIKRFDIW